MKTVKCNILKNKIGVITQLYHLALEKGYGYPYYGIDIVGWNGLIDDIIAYKDGTVIEVRNDCQKYENDSYGNYVIIQHDNNVQTLYSQMKYKSIPVSIGDKVKKGQVIGRMGNTGTSYGPHLHFELKIDKLKVNPQGYAYNEIQESE